MDIYVARQPIFDKKNKVFAYELLYRDSNENSFHSDDGDRATIEVLRNSIINIGIDELTDNKMAFINFTENILKSDILNVIPTNQVVIELLEIIAPSAELLEICKTLKHKGFILALDDFVFKPEYRDLLDVVDIVKVDFRITTGYERKKVIENINRKNIKFLAEKVETIEEFNEAVSYGYEYFQGYYLSKPTIIAGRKIPENQMIYLRILNMLSREDAGVEVIEDIIKKDMSLSYKLLRLTNSSAFGFKSKIKSIKHAVSLLGETEVKKWLYLIVIHTIAQDKPDIIIKNSLIRARLSELLDIHIGDNEFNNAYLVGLLSMIDVLLNKPLLEITNEISLDTKIKEALMGKESSTIGVVLKLVKNYEKGDLEIVKWYAKKLNLDIAYITDAYIEAIKWAKIDSDFEG